MTAALFGEGPGGFVVSGEADALRELGEGVPAAADRPRRRRGAEDRRAGEAVGAPIGLALTLAELAGAHAGLGELFS